MSVRAAVAVVAALAVVGAAMPAVEHAEQRRDGAAVRASADRAADAVRELYRRSDPGDGVSTAPRRTVTVALPADANLTVAPDGGALVVARANGARIRYRVPVPVRVCGDRRSLRGPVTLAYVDAGRGPVVLAVRGFIRGNGTTAAHACTPRPPRADRRPGLRV